MHCIPQDYLKLWFFCCSDRWDNSDKWPNWESKIHFCWEKREWQRHHIDLAVFQVAFIWITLLQLLWRWRKECKVFSLQRFISFILSFVASDKWPDRQVRKTESGKDIALKDCQLWGNYRLERRKKWQRHCIAKWSSREAQASDRMDSSNVRAIS